MVLTLRGRLHFGKKNAFIATPPVLLLGPPGIGKTEWTGELARLLDVPFKVLNVSGALGIDQLASLGRAGQEESVGLLKIFLRKDW